MNCGVIAISFIIFPYQNLYAMNCKLFLVLLIACFTGQLAAQESQSEAVRLVQMQLDGYNARDIEMFLAPYSDSIKIYMYPDQLRSQGIESMRQSYGKMFANTPDLHCELANRVVMGNTVIDHERVVIRKGQPVVEAIAVYKISDGKIAEVRFIYPEKKE
jgi:hypothetical protein